MYQKAFPDEERPPFTPERLFAARLWNATGGDDGILTLMHFGECRAGKPLSSEDFTPRDPSASNPGFAEPGARAKI